MTVVAVEVGETTSNPEEFANGLGILQPASKPFTD